MTNTIYKAIMTRTKLRNKFLGLKTRQESHITKKETFVFLLFEMQKKHFYENLDPNLITDNRKLWKQVKPFFSTKTPDCSKIILLEGNQIINENLACVKVLNNYFTGAVDELDIDSKSIDNKSCKPGPQPTLEHMVLKAENSSSNDFYKKALNKEI